MDRIYVSRNTDSIQTKNRRKTDGMQENQLKFAKIFANLLKTHKTEDLFQCKMEKYTSKKRFPY